MFTSTRTPNLSLSFKISGMQIIACEPCFAIFFVIVNCWGIFICVEQAFSRLPIAQDHMHLQNQKDLYATSLLN